MRIRWRHIKRAFVVAGATFFTLAVTPTIGQFFISLAENHGLYKNPDALVFSMMDFIRALADATWFHWIGGGIIGFAIGAYIDSIMKERGSNPAMSESSKMINLQWAAQELYGRIGKCYLRDMIDRAGKDFEGKINVAGGIIADYADIFGMRGPSHVMDKIEHDELSQLKLTRGALYLQYHGTSSGDDIVYHNLSVKRDDFERAVAAVLNV